MGYFLLVRALRRIATEKFGISEAPLSALSCESMALTTGGLSVLLTLIFWACDFREKKTAYAYMTVAVVVTLLNVALLLYPSATGSAIWSDPFHYKLELFAFLWVSAIMGAVIVADSFFWMPVDIYRKIKQKQQEQGTNKFALDQLAGCKYMLQVYIHHIMGGVGMWWVAYKLQEVNGGKGFSFEGTQSLYGAENMWGKVGATSSLLCTIRFTNRFVFAAEFSTIFKYVRDLLRFRSISVGQPTPRLVRYACDLAFVFAFLLCRIMPLLPGLILSLNCGLPACDYLLRSLFNALTSLSAQSDTPLVASSALFLRDGILFQSPREAGGDALFNALSRESSTEDTAISAVVASMYWGFGILNIQWTREIFRTMYKTLFGAGKKGAKKATAEKDITKVGVDRSASGASTTVGDEPKKVK